MENYRFPRPQSPTETQRNRFLGLRRERKGASSGYVESFRLFMTSRSPPPLLAQCQDPMKAGLVTVYDFSWTSLDLTLLAYLTVVELTLLDLT